MHRAGVDTSVLGGPIAGYYASQVNPSTARDILMKETLGQRMVYRITMGVRSSDQNWKRQLNKLIVKKQPAINKILLDFNVPFWTATIGSLPAIRR